MDGSSLPVGLACFELIDVLNGCKFRKLVYGSRIFVDPSGHTPASCAFTVHRDFDANISEVRIHSNFLRQCLIGKLEARDPVSLVKLVSHYSYLQTLLAALDFRAEFTERPDYGKSLYEGHILYANGSSELDLLLKAVVLFSPNDVDASRRSRYLHTFWYLEYYCVDIQHKSAINALTTINDKFQSHISSACYDSIDIAIPEVSSASRVGGILKKLQDHARESSSSQPVWGTFDELDDCLVWMVSETRSIWKTREDRILDALLHCPALRRIKDLISQLPLQDAARFSGWTIVFDYDVVQSLSKEDLALVPGCRTIRRLRPEEKEKIITKKLHNDFKTEDQKFRQSVSKICFRPESTFVTEKDKACVLRTTSHFTHRQVNQWQPLGTIPHHNPAQNNSFANSCRFIHKRYNKAWDKGIAVIRRFLQGKRPDTLEKICRLLQVAYAMGLQSTHRENFEVDFRNDLGRWRTIVPLHSVASFDAIVAAVWGKRFDKASSELDLEYGFNETLLQLQDLMSSLISGFPLVNIEKDLPETDGDNQSTDGSQCAIDITYEKVQKEVDKMPDPRAYSDSRRIPIDPVPADPIVVLMMAGAIFGFIFSFLLIIQACRLPTSAAKVAEMRNIPFANFEERLLFTLLAFMGLSTSPFSWGCQYQPTEEPSSSDSTFSVPDPDESEDTPTTQDITRPQSPSDTVLTPPSVPQRSASKSRIDRLECRRCSKRFSNVGNLNRHTRYDCNRKAQFECRNPGCSVKTTRKAYRDKHESTKCPWRTTLL